MIEKKKADEIYKMASKESGLGGLEEDKGNITSAIFHYKAAVRYYNEFIKYTAESTDRRMAERRLAAIDAVEYLNEKITQIEREK